MKVMLIFPPQSITVLPPLGLPSLTSVLRAKGQRVIQKDVNMEMHDIFFSRPELKRADRFVTREFERLATIKRQRRLSPQEQKKFNVLAPLCLAGIYLSEEIDDAKKTIKSECFYDLPRLVKSIRVLAASLKLVSAPYYPTQLDINPRQSNTTPAYDSSRELLMAVENRTTNIYYDFFRRHTIPSIQEDSPRVIGISINAREQLIPGLTLCRMIKDKMPEAHVVVGGDQITRLAGTLASHKDYFSFFDSIILGEGETPLLELITRLGEKKNLAGIPNVVYRRGKSVRPGRPNHEEDINSLPTPDFGGLPLDLYLSPQLVLPIQASRGCYWGRCAFCQIGREYLGNRRRKDIGRVIRDINKLKRKHNPGLFFFVDDALAPRTMRSLSLNMIKKNIGVHWMAVARFEKDLTSAGFSKNLFQSGCRALDFGLESASQRMLNLMDKGIDIQIAKMALQRCREAGIQNYLSVFFGFPTETREDALETRKFLFENESHIHQVHSVGKFILQPSSPAFKHPERYGITKVMKNDDQDLRNEFDYEVAAGLNRDEALKMSCSLREEFPLKWKMEALLSNTFYSVFYGMKYNQADFFTQKGVNMIVDEVI
jgi:anaerobic magnesium-protoporphyrin IX monomethyl ester cyclase